MQDFLGKGTYVHPSGTCILSALRTGNGLPLRFLRTGLLIGELKKGRFEPSQALAMALRIEEYPVVLNLLRKMSVWRAT